MKIVILKILNAPLVQFLSPALSARSGFQETKKCHTMHEAASLQVHTKLNTINRSRNRDFVMTF
jgi:hypothetical protein